MRLTSSPKSKVNFNDTECNRVHSAFGLVWIYLDDTAMFMEFGAPVKYSIHGLLLNSCKKLQQNVFTSDIQL